MLKRVLLSVLLLILPLAAQAQTSEPATLVADRILFGRTTDLVAEGNVEVFWNGIRLKATRIRFDPRVDKLTIEGPIEMDDGTGNVIFAEQAEIDTKLQDGIMRAAKLIIQDRLTITADTLERQGQRYTTLRRVAASACEVCEKNPVPLWEVRAESVVHDQVAQQVRFRNAQLRMFDFPIFWLPTLKIPDPSVERANGFLVPRLRTTTSLGVGLKLPYFVTFGQHADFTITPYLSPNTRTMELQFRRATPTGSYQFDAAVSSDDIRPGDLRAYLFGKGAFRLPGDFIATADIQLTSDEGYLLDYDYSSLDRLTNEVAVTKTTANSFFTASVRNIRTLRDSELPIKDTLPSSLINVSWERRFRPDMLPGTFDVNLALDGFERVSNADMLGRDVLRAKSEVIWSARRVFDLGLVADAKLGAKGLFYLIGEDTTYDNQIINVAPAATVSLRWPLMKRTAGGTSLIEPVLQVGWSDVYGKTVPNEDSTVAEFDEGNLLALSRFPGDDRTETGVRTAIGINWAHDFASGWTFGASAGRLFRFEAQSDFTDASGLEDIHSDWLFSVRATNPDGLSFNSRFLVAPNTTITKATASLDWSNRRFDLSAGYNWAIADLGENRPDPLSEVTFDGDWYVSEGWTASAEFRYDPRESDVRNATLGVTYQNECITVDFGVSRRFTASTSVDPTTDVNLRVALGGFGEKAGPARRVCGR